MHFSKISITVLTGTATASSYLPELNCTGLAAVLVGAGPVMNEATTIPERLAVISMRTRHYKWHNKPVPLTLVPTSTAFSEEQVKRRDPLQVYHSLTTSLPPAPTIFGGTTLVRKHKPKSTALDSDTAILQRATTTGLTGATEDIESMLQNRAVDWNSGLEITARIQTIQTISPTWSISPKKWHGPHSHPETTATVSHPMDDLPVITASA